jgi:hypothetical protein
MAHVPPFVLKSSTVWDFDQETLTAPEYKGYFIFSVQNCSNISSLPFHLANSFSSGELVRSLLGAKQNFPDESSFVAHIHFSFLQLAMKANLYYLLCSVGVDDFMYRHKFAYFFVCRVYVTNIQSNNRSEQRNSLGHSESQSTTTTKMDATAKSVFFRLSLMGLFHKEIFIDRILRNRNIPTRKNTGFSLEPPENRGNFMLLRIRKLFRVILSLRWLITIFNQLSSIFGYSDASKRRLPAIRAAVFSRYGDN